MSTNELGNIDAELAAFNATPELNTESGNPVADLDVESIADTIEATETDIEIPESDFFNADRFEDGDLFATEDATEPEAEPEIDTVDAHDSISYKANGQEVTLSREEAIKKLSMYDGQQQAFADRAKLRKEVADLKKRADENASYKETWDKLEDIKDDIPRLIQTLSGEDYNAFLEKELQKRQAYAEASPAEQRAMDSEERLSRLERERAQELKKLQRDNELAQQRADRVEKEAIQTTMTQEFSKHLDGLELSESMQEMYWLKANADLKKYVAKGYPPNYKDGALIRKVFSDAAAEFSSHSTSKADKVLQEAVQEKKASAKKNAQLDARQNYGKPSTQDLSQLDPVSLFRKFSRGR